jgi:hypothetical protein
LFQVSVADASPRHPHGDRGSSWLVALLLLSYLRKPAVQPTFLILFCGPGSGFARYFYILVICVTFNSYFINIF